MTQFTDKDEIKSAILAAAMEMTNYLYQGFVEKTASGQKKRYKAPLLHESVSVDMFNYALFDLGENPRLAIFQTVVDALGPVSNTDFPSSNDLQKTLLFVFGAHTKSKTFWNDIEASQIIKGCDTSSFLSTQIELRREHMELFGESSYDKKASDLEKPRQEHRKKAAAHLALLDQTKEKEKLTKDVLEKYLKEFIQIIVHETKNIDTILSKQDSMLLDHSVPIQSTSEQGDLAIQGDLMMDPHRTKEKVEQSRHSSRSVSQPFASP